MALLLLLGCRDKAELIKAAVLHLKSGLEPKLKTFFWRRLVGAGKNRNISKNSKCHKTKLRAEQRFWGEWTSCRAFCFRIRAFWVPNLVLFSSECQPQFENVVIMIGFGASICKNIWECVQKQHCELKVCGKVSGRNL